MRIVDAYSIREMLEPYLNGDEINRLLALAISKIVRPLPMRSMQAWYEGTNLSVILPANITSQRNSC